MLKSIDTNNDHLIGFSVDLNLLAPDPIKQNKIYQFILLTTYDLRRKWTLIDILVKEQREKELCFLQNTLNKKKKSK